LATYEPTGPNDAESISERVTARLSHANPAVVLTAIKARWEFHGSFMGCKRWILWENKLV
jgi:vesicle coat complex subunit